MEKQAFTKRFIVPAAKLCAVMTLSYAIYRLSWQIENDHIHRILSHVFAIILFVSLGFGTFYVYPTSFFRGAGSAERILISIINPFIWSTKEVFVLSGVYTLGESLYFYLSPTNVLLYSGVMAQIGLCEILCRKRLAGHGVSVKIFSVPATAALLLGLASVVLIFAWDLGVHHFYIFQEGFKAIWTYGIGI